MRGIWETIREGHTQPPIRVTGDSHISMETTLNDMVNFAQLDGNQTLNSSITSNVGQSVSDQPIPVIITHNRKPWIIAHHNETKSNYKPIRKTIKRSNKILILHPHYLY